MYNEDVLRLPVDMDDLWALLEEQFAFVRHILVELHVESREEALGLATPGFSAADRKLEAMSKIRYRDTGEEWDNRNYYLELGRSLIPEVTQAIRDRIFTPQFVQQWGKVMFCHGYLASYVFDDTDDLGATRGGFGGRKDLQRRWVAAVLKKSAFSWLHSLGCFLYFAGICVGRGQTAKSEKIP